jgi:hypothetical protein
MVFKLSRLKKYITKSVNYTIVFGKSSFQSKYFLFANILILITSREEFIEPELKSVTTMPGGLSIFDTGSMEEWLHGQMR